MIDEILGFHTNLAQLVHNLNVLLGILVAVHADRHQEVLGSSGQLQLKRGVELGVGVSIPEIKVCRED